MNHLLCFGNLLNPSPLVIGLLAFWIVRNDFALVLMIEHTDSFIEILGFRSVLNRQQYDLVSLSPHN